MSLSVGLSASTGEEKMMSSYYFKNSFSSNLVTDYQSIAELTDELINS